MPANDDKLDEAIAQGLAAVESDDLEAAEEALESAQKIAGENHVRTLHLAGMIAWAGGETERALGFLMQASDLGSDRPDIYLDCAEAILVSGEDVTEAEVAVRSALDLPSITDRERDEAHLTLAQIRLEVDDAAGALATLTEISEGLREHPAFLSTQAAALMAADRTEEAVASIAKAVEQEPEDPDFHYQLALTCRVAGDLDRSRAAMARVLELDAAGDGDEEGELAFAEVQDLRARMEEVLEDLPDPILRLVANAPITVQRRATPEQVAGGADARSIVIFTGTPKRGDEEAELSGVVVMRNLLVEEVNDDDDIGSALFYGVMEELREFFDREDVLFALAEG